LTAIGVDIPRVRGGAATVAKELIILANVLHIVDNEFVISNIFSSQGGDKQ
jgi:hypothetical protein